MRFSFLGAVTVEGPHGPVAVRGQQPALLLARLVLDRPRALRREDLAEMLWLDAPPPGWPAVARKVVSRARDVLSASGAPESVLRSEQGSIRFEPTGPVEVDVEAAVAMVDAAEAALTDDATKAAALAEAAIGMLDGSFLPGVETGWASAWRARLGALTGRSYYVAIEAALALDHPTRATDLGHAALLRDPFDERAAQLLMRALMSQEHTAGAIAVYERLRRTLDEQLGVRPAPDTEQVYRDVLGAAPIATEPSAAPPSSGWATGQDERERTAFVGRDAEVRAIDAAWRAAATGARVVLVEGEPGIGKTRLVRAAVDNATTDGALVIWAQCDPGARVPHAVFTDLLRQLLVVDPELPARLGPVGGYLVSLVPELGNHSAAPPTSNDRARNRLASAVTAAVEAFAESDLVVVIDDVQWADGDTLALLERVVPVLADRPVLLVLIARERPPEVARVLVDLARAVPVDHIGLRGLDADALDVLLREAAVDLPDDRRVVAELLADRTGGNPLYATQLLLEALHSGRPFDPGALPPAVAQLAERRLAPVDGDARGVLLVGAVIGPEFPLATLEACSALAPDRVLEVVEDLCRLQLLTERAPEVFGFVHEVIRDAVLAAVSATRRERIHRRVADALAGTDAHAGVLAHHLVAGGPDATAEAVHASLAAGEEAIGRAAWAAAETQFATAARLATAPDECGAALVGLGRARRALGDVPGARGALDEARQLAVAADRPRTLAAATLALVGGGGRGVALELADAERAGLLRAAIVGLGPDDADLLVPGLAELSLALVLTDAAAERAALCERALTAARESGDGTLVAHALLARRTMAMGPGGTESRFADGQEALALPPGAMPPEDAIALHLGLVEDLLELGHRGAADRALARADELARALDHPYWRWAATCWRTLASIIDGRLDEAEALAGAAFALQADADHPEALAAYGVHLVDVRLFQGRSGEMLDLLEDAADANPHIPTYRAVLALCALEAGDEARGRAAYERCGERAFALPDDSNWLLGTAVLADACATLGDQAGAELLQAALLPWAERQVVLNCYGGGGAYWGPVTHHLGRLAAVLGDHVGSTLLLTDAARRAERFGAPAFAARSQAALRTN